MAHIVSYQKQSDAYTVYQLNAPEGSTELCTIGGVTYVSVPDDIAMPDQNALITYAVATLTSELKEAIKAASPHVQLIDQRVREKIADAYPIHEEIKLLRTAPSAEFDAYNAFAEACRQWGRDQKTVLGL